MPTAFETIDTTDEVCMKHRRAEPCPDCLVEQVVQLRIERDDIQALLHVTSKRLDTFITALAEAQARYVKAEAELDAAYTDYAAVNARQNEVIDRYRADNERMRAVIAALEKKNG